MIDYQVDGDGIATITWALTDSPMNVFNAGSTARFAECVGRALGDETVKGAIVTSGRTEFVVGGDLNELLAFTDYAGMRAHMRANLELFRRIEAGGKPFVAAINGTALGGGYELALACHRRIAADDPKLRIGLPEITLGLFPGAGGTQRLPRQIGVKKALDVILTGRTYTAAEALDLGMIDGIATLDRLLAEAKAWLMAADESAAVKPWDRRGYRMPDSAILTPTAAMFSMANAAWHEKTHGNNSAVKSVLSCVYEGSIVDIDTALEIESKYFVRCALSPEAKNTLRTMYFSIGDANKLKRRPEGVAKSEVTRAGVVGAGMMGGAIAYCIARSGCEVALIDSSIEFAEKGKAASGKILAYQLERGRIDATERDAVLARIAPAAEMAALEGAQFVIEAVFEDRAVKAGVHGAIEAVIAEDAILATNTSTLPIAGLASALARPANFLGTHFFSPADRMPLVEVVRGAATDDACLARALDFLQRIRKTPIVVNDGRGFFASRTVGTYVDEGMIMLAEGVPAALVENVGRLAGMPVGPLSLTDEVALELLHGIRRQTKADLGDAYRGNRSDEVLALMVEKLKRKGRKSGGGFYDYPAEGDKFLWPGLAGHFPVRADVNEFEQIKRRLIYVQCLEAARCLEENVLTDPRDGDVGSVLGWGFPAFRGGVISQIHSLGIGVFVEQCEELADAHGERFTPPRLLRDMAAGGRAFYEF